jgi:signal transduction histidine kinase/ActR/RegA family two-component response regulator
MKITQRLIVLFLIVSLSLGAYIYLFFLIKQEEGRLYSQADALQRRQILNAFIDIRRNEVMRLAAETAAAPEMLKYVRSRSRDRGNDNLKSLLTRYDLDLVQVYDTAGVAIYSTSTPSNLNLYQYRLPAAFFKSAEQDRQMHFTQAWKQQYIQLSAAPIGSAPDSTVKQVSRGFLVLGRIWSVSYLEGLSQGLDYSLRFYTSEPLSETDKSVFNVNLTIPLTGWDKRSIAWLRFSGDNPFIEQWQSLGKRLLFGMLAFTLVFLFLQFALLFTWIRTPLRMISNSLKFGNPELIAPIIKTNNEFGEIAKLIKRFFEQNQQLRNEMEERRKTEIMLRQAQKMESIGTLAGGIAHDFNNIITIISGYVALASGKAKDQPDVCNNLDEAMVACLRAKKLIEKILTYSRQTEKNVQPVNMAAAVQETIDLLSHTIPASIKINTDIRTAAHVLADPVEMQQVVMNIVTNSYHAMRYEGGTIYIVLEEVPGAEVGRAVPEADTDLDYLCLTVSDTGTGIPQEMLERIFDPYFSTKAAGEGTGLGLSIVHGIVTGTDGYIKIDSVVNQGTTFRVYLPTTTLRIIEKPAPEKKAVFVPAKLYFVDDEPALTNLFRETLTEAGYSVKAFTEAEAALQEFSGHPEECDLLVADIAMPEINGIQLAQKVRRFKPQLPIILYSGFSDATIQKNCRELGINRLLVKPVLPETLAHIIREILAEQKPSIRLPL